MGNGVTLKKLIGTIILLLKTSDCHKHASKFGISHTENVLKVVICGKYENLNKITKFTDFIFCYSLQFTMQN